MASSVSEIFRLYVLCTVHHAQNHDAVVIGAIINAALPIRETAQSLRDMVAGRAGEIRFGDPCDFRREVCHEFLRVIGAGLGDVPPYLPQILQSERGEYQAFRFNGPSFLS